MTDHKILRALLFQQLPYSVMAGFTGINTGKNFSPPRHQLNLGKYSGDPLVEENYKVFCEHLGLQYDSLAWLKQIHGARINKVKQPGYQGEADGLITDGKNITLLVQTADCMPVLVAHREVPFVAALHAGWQGLKKGIHRQFLRAVKEIGYHPSQFLFAVGPHLRQCHFEVTEEFLEYFPKKYFMKKGEIWYFDPGAYLVADLTQIGVPENQIEMHAVCTYCNSSYYSWRQNKTSGRQIGFITIQ